MLSSRLAFRPKFYTYFMFPPGALYFLLSLSHLLQKKNLRMNNNCYRPHLAYFFTLLQSIFTSRFHSCKSLLTSRYVRQATRDLSYLMVLGVKIFSLLGWLLPWRWRQYFSPKCPYPPARLHDITTHNTAVSLPEQECAGHPIWGAWRNTKFQNRKKKTVLRNFIDINNIDNQLDATITAY